MDLSVVVPAYNAGRYLSAAIESVLRELPSAAEILIVDDGSTDDTREVIASFGPRVRSLSNSTPLGPGEARNLGASAARGTFLAFHDADDLVLPGRFREELDLLGRDARAQLVFANGIKIDTAGREVGPVIPVRHSRRLARRVSTADVLRGGFVYLQTVCIRRSDFLALGGLRRRSAEDWDFALRASLRLELRFIDRPYFAYRQRPDSVTSDQSATADAVLETIESFLACNPEVVELVGRRCARMAVARRLARCARHRARNGDRIGAAQALARAIELVPTSLRYRLRYLTLAFSARPVQA